MKELYSQSISGNCTTCECELTNGGWLYFNGQNDITKLLCPACKEFKEVTGVKKSKLVVQKLSGLFGWMNGWYQIVSTKNLIIKNNIIKEDELLKLIERQGTEVIIRG